MKDAKNLIERRNRHHSLMLFLCFFFLSVGMSEAVYAATTEIDQRQVQIRGVVKDAGGEPIVGATVQLKGSSVGTITDLEGNYRLSVPGSRSVLVISYIGYATKEVTVGNQQTINVTLEEDAKLIDEVVITGFAAQRKKDLTGAVASVSSAAIENKPVGSLGQALQGVIPNLNVSAVSAQPNAAATFNVRGGTTMYYDQNDNDKLKIKNGSPLILVDNVQVDETQLSMLNPSDIESVTVLKDAASAAIYGARATYGVMLVTTKSGQKEQKATVNYTFNMQWNTPSHYPDIMDAYTIQQSAINLDLWTTGGKPSAWTENVLMPAMKAWKENPTTAPQWVYNEGSQTKFTWVGSMDPFKEVVRDWTPMQKHTVSVSGGTAKTRYYISLGYQDQEGMYKINTDEQKKYNVLMSIDTEINNWFKVAGKISYNVSNFNEPYLNPQKGTLWGAMFNEVNRNIRMPIKTGPNDPVPDAWTDNILGWIAYGATHNRYRSNALFNVVPTVTFMPGWTAKVEFTYVPTEYFDKVVVPTREYVVDDWTSISKTHTDPSHIDENSNHSDLYTINAYTTFDKKFGDHFVSGVLGFNQEWYTYRSMFSKADGMLNADIPYIDAATGAQYSGDGANEYALRAAFARVLYSFKDRYLVQFNGRYDGTSRFPKKDRFKMFPSFSAGWRISEEPFMKSTRHILDNLKLRVSWGSLGNQNVDNYIYVPAYGSVDYVSWNMGGSRPMSLTPPGLVSPSLTWETATTLDFGIDVTLLKNKLDFTFDWYTRETKDILVAGDALPSVLGAKSPMKNSGILSTKGWDLTLKWQDRINKDLSYDVSFVLSDYLTKVKYFGGNPNKSLSTLYTGMTMGEIWGYQYVGILQKEDFDIDANGKYILKGASQTDMSSTWYPGDFRFADLSGTKGTDEYKTDTGEPDGKVNKGEDTVYNSGDRRIIGNSTPRLQFGLDGNIRWKDLSLNIFFQGVGKKDVYINNVMLFGGTGNAGNLDTYNNSWTPERTDAKYHMYGRAQNKDNVNTRYLYNGAFIRLKTLALSYNLPKKWLQPLSLNAVRVSLSGYNLFEISEIPNVFDPESIQSAYPMMRSVALGVNVKF